MSTGTSGQVGLLLPTFDTQCTPQRVGEAAQKAEAYGFASVWVRDHLYMPKGTLHGGIQESGLHLEPLMSLAHAGAVTSRVALGSAVLIPLRHPLALLQILGTLSFLSGGRVVVGLGLGAFKREFDAVGLDYSKRRQTVHETLDILRRAADGKPLSYDGELFQFEDVSIDPVLPAGTPIWYGGSGSPRSARLAFDYGFEGWMGNAPADVFDNLIALGKEWSEEGGRRFGLGTLPLTAVAATPEEALAHFDVPDLITSISANVRKEYTTFEQVESAMVIGTPGQAAARIQSFWENGVSPVILDLRAVGEAFDDMLDLMGSEMMPLLGVA